MHDPHPAVRHQREPDQRDDQTAQWVRQELERGDIDDRAERASGLEVARRLAQHVGEREGKEEKADEHDHQPPFDTDPRGQPAAQPHDRSSSRWNTATGPMSRSRSQVAKTSERTMLR